MLIFQSVKTIFEISYFLKFCIPLYASDSLRAALKIKKRIRTGNNTKELKLETFFKRMKEPETAINITGQAARCSALP